MKNDYKSFFAGTPSILDLSTISESSEGRMRIAIDKVCFETCLLKPETGSDRLYVLLTALNSKLSYPRFTHQKWSQFLDGCCLYIDDPTRYEHKLKFHPCFYWGNSNIRYWTLIQRLILKIASVNSIPTSNITLIGSSNAGFASIKIAASINNCNCIALCPQVSITEYFGSNFEKFTKEFNTHENLADFENSINCQKDILNTNSNIAIYSNIRRSRDNDFDQMKLLFSWFGLSELKIGLTEFQKNIKIIIADIDAPDPHVAQPGISFVKYIEDFVLQNRFKETTINSYLEDMKILYSCQKNLKIKKGELLWNTVLPNFVKNMPSILHSKIDYQKNYQQFPFSEFPDYLHYEFIYSKDKLFFCIHYEQEASENVKKLFLLMAKKLNTSCSEGKKAIKINKEITFPEDLAYIEALRIVYDTIESICLSLNIKVK